MAGYSKRAKSAKQERRDENICTPGYRCADPVDASWIASSQALLAMTVKQRGLHTHRRHPEEPGEAQAKPGVSKDGRTCVCGDPSRLTAARRAPQDDGSERGAFALPAQLGDPLADSAPAALFERIGLPPSAVFRAQGHLFGPLAMLGQHRPGGAIDDVAPDQSGPHRSVP
jgi:hypothetical protein